MGRLPHYHLALQFMSAMHVAPAAGKAQIGIRAALTSSGLSSKRML